MSAQPALTTSNRRPADLLLWLALVVLLLALGLRLDRLDGQSFWYDEGTSVILAGRDLPTIARDAAADIHPPLYYFLLHYWTAAFGTSEVAARSLSAALGVLLVAVTWLLGRRLFDGWLALAAGLLAAVSPVAVYYAQETRMYTLAALLGAASVLAAVYLIQGWQAGRGWWPLPLVGYVTAALGALYSHYFAFTAPLAANLIVLVWAIQRRAWRPLAVWLGANLLIAAVFLPWLLRALPGIRAWPAVSAPFTLPFLVQDSLRVFSLGRGAEWSPWALLFAALLLVGAFLPAPRRRSSVVPADEALSDGFARFAATAYLAAPLLVMFVLSLGRPMYNPKFLLVVLPPFALLLARGALLPARWWSRLGTVASALLLLGVVGVSVAGLRGYYFDPRQARDDYRGIARYLAAAGRPGDAVILNAPAQAEVFSLYDSGNLPVYPLPQQRPADRAKTEATLAELARDHQRVFGVFWATNESDPQGIVEDWLNSHAYKAADSWWGNLRLTMYALPTTSGEARPIGARLGDQFTLDSARLAATSVEAGDVLPLSLRWTALQSIDKNVTVFVHLVAPNGVILAQRDAVPAGQPTTGWLASESRDDNHGILVPFGTPPGPAELRVGLYDAATGQRLPVASGGDYVRLGPVEVSRPAVPPPVEVFNLPARTDAQFGDLTLLGLSAFRRGFDHAPDTPVHAGDELQVLLYWQAGRDAPRSPGGDVTLALGDTAARVDASPGATYPLDQWRAGEVVRAVHLLPLPADLPAGRYALMLGDERLMDIDVTAR